MACSGTYGTHLYFLFLGNTHILRHVVIHILLAIYSDKFDSEYKLKLCKFENYIRINALAGSLCTHRK